MTALYDRSSIRWRATLDLRGLACGIKGTWGIESGLGRYYNRRRK